MNGPTTPLRRRGLAGLLLVGALGLAACGDDGDPASSASAATTPTTAMAPTTANAMGSDGAMLTKSNFGPGCAAVPSSGAGSFSGMAADPAATAASNNPALSTLVTAVKAAGLVDTLNGPGPFTIFAPTNDAFAKLPKATLDGVLADPTGALTNILTYHVVAGEKLDAAGLAQETMATTVQGDTVSVAADGDTIEINGQSAVVCGNVKTANATVHIIDTVLMPKM
jgi:uncharacterized surface protein with fasciclin (FAS1) repeats